MKNQVKAVSRIALVAVVVVVIAAAAVGGLFLTGVLTPQPQKRQIVIGLSLPLTNPVGIHAMYAAEMAVEEILIKKVTSFLERFRGELARVQKNLNNLTIT